MTEETKSLNATHKPDPRADTSGVPESTATAPIELTAMVLTTSIFLTFLIGWKIVEWPCTWVFEGEIKADR